MKFIFGNPFLVAGVVIGLAGLMFLRPFYGKLNDRFVALAERKGFLAAGFIVLGLFYVFFVLSKPVFYTDFMGGVVGDNYRYVNAGVGNPDYASPQHFYFPYAPAQVLRAAVRWSIYDKDAPTFLEKAFIFFSLPSRLFYLVGLLVFVWTLRRSGRTTAESLVGAWFLATCFGYWFWPLQSNALGFLLPLMLTAISFSILAVQSGAVGYYVLAAVCACLCVYTHIASAFPVVGVVGSTACLALWRYRKDRKLKDAIGAAVYIATVIALGAVFYYLLVRRYGVHPPAFYIAVLSDYATLGGFSLKGFLPMLVRDGIGKNAALMAGMIQSPGKPAWEMGLIAVQLTLFSFLILSILRQRSYRDWFKMDDPPLVLAAGAFFAALIGFSIRDTWLQYYSTIVPASVFTLVLAALPARRNEGRGNHLILVLLVLCGVTVNGFSSSRVFSGGRPEDNAVYRTLSFLKQFAGEEKVLLAADRRAYPYNFDGFMLYYASPGRKFDNIRWVETLSPAEFAAEASGVDMVLAEGDRGPVLAGTQLPNFVSDRIETGFADLPVLWRWRKAKELP